MIQKLFIMNGYFYGFSRFLEAKAKMALQNFHEYYCFIQNKFIMTHISVNHPFNQSVNQSVTQSVTLFILCAKLLALDMSIIYCTWFQVYIYDIFV